MGKKSRRREGKAKRGAPNAWAHLPPNQAELMRRWEEWMPIDLIMPEKGTKAETMKALAITPEFVEGIPVGNWQRLNMRLREAEKPVNFANHPPLKRGDRVEVLAGNSVKWGQVGKRGKLNEFFGDDGKWGIEMEDTGEGVLVMAGNLKRIPKEEGTVKETSAGYVNHPPLAEGDCVEILRPSGSAGKRWICQLRFEEDENWGVGLEGGSSALVKAGNLKRIPGPIEGVKEPPGQWTYVGPPGDDVLFDY
ncbi:hypothetical protein ACHAXT_011771 [Thalassiosira profunda]